MIFVRWGICRMDREQTGNDGFDLSFAFFFLGVGEVENTQAGVQWRRASYQQAS